MEFIRKFLTVYTSVDSRLTFAPIKSGVVCHSTFTSSTSDKDTAREKTYVLTKKGLYKYVSGKLLKVKNELSDPSDVPELFSTELERLVYEMGCCMDCDSGMAGGIFYNHVITDMFLKRNVLRNSVKVKKKKTKDITNGWLPEGIYSFINQELTWYPSEEELVKSMEINRVMSDTNIDLKECPYYDPEKDDFEPVISKVYTFPMCESDYKEDMRLEIYLGLT